MKQLIKVELSHWLKEIETKEGYINIWDTWFSGRYKIPDNIRPEEIHHSKLLLVTGKLKREGLPERVWNALANPQITWRELRRELLGSTEEIHQEKINFRLEKDLLIAYANNQRAEVARIFEPETELEKKAYLEIKRRLNLKEL